MTDEQIGTIHLMANTRNLEDFCVELRALLSASIADTAGAKQTYPVGEVELQEGGYVGVRWLKPAPDEGTPLYAATPASSVSDAAGASEASALNDEQISKVWNQHVGQLVPSLINVLAVSRAIESITLERAARILDRRAEDLFTDCIETSEEMERAARQIRRLKESK